MQTIVKNSIRLIAISLWVVIGLLLAQLLIVKLYEVIAIFQPRILGGFTEVTLQLVVAALVYTLTLLLVVGVPKIVLKKSTSLKDLGLSRLPNWVDLLLPIAGFIVYMVLAWLMFIVAEKYIPGFQIDQEQDVGFTRLNTSIEYMLAFVSLVIIAPVAEEIIFRGYLYDKLKKNGLSLWAVFIVVSLLFGLVHGQWNVAVNVFALSIVLCGLRVITGSIWSSILLHSLKNGVAYYMLFVNPVLSTIGG